jgi:DNA repair photolyase
VTEVPTGRRHGCRFCSVSTTPPYRSHAGKFQRVDVNHLQREWGGSVLYRDEFPEQLESALESIDAGDRAFETTDRGRGVFGISYSTDRFIDGRAGGIPRQCVELLAEFGHYARVQTRNPILPLQDLDTFQTAGEHSIVGTSLPSLNDAESTAIELSAPAPSHRLQGLEKFADAGVQAFVSVTPRGANFELAKQAAADAGEYDLHQALVEVDDREEHWIGYQLEHFRWVQAIGAELGLPIHLWPDEQLINSVDARERAWLQAWTARESPEPFADREPSVDPRPELSPRRAATTDIRGWSA